jgi:hypothetical protein
MQPHSALVIICCTTVATLNISFRELFIHEAWTDWPEKFCCVGACSVVCVPDFIAAGCTCWSVWCCVPFLSVAAKDCSGVVSLEVKIFPVASLGVDLRCFRRACLLSHACSPCTWWGGDNRLLSECSCSIVVLTLLCLALGIPCVGDHLHTTSNEEVACS